jgi:DNA polymerase (family 10)
LADLMELAGENFFKIRAYRKAAETIRGLLRPLKEIPPTEIANLPGIGKAIADKIASALETGAFPTLVKWRQSGYAQAAGRY